MSRSGKVHGPLVVLHTARHRKDKGNPYTVMLMNSMPADILSLEFNWVRAIAGHYDVVHLHWPELMLRDPDTVRRGIKNILFAVMYVRLILTRTPVVQTLHNLAPHESGSAYQRRILAALGRRTGTWILLNPASVDIPAGQSVEILHGHYRDWFADYTKPATDPGRYLFFGLIRPYKQVVSLIDAFLELGDPNTSLRIVGAVTDPAVQQRASSLVDEPTVSVDFAFVSDERLAHEVGLAELVVLPYREFYNSGAALLALSLGHPILTPRSEASEALQDEFGEDWVLLYEGELGSAHLKSAMTHLRQCGSTATLPDLSRREWTEIAAAHAQVYTSAAG